MLRLHQIACLYKLVHRVSPGMHLDVRVSHNSRDLRQSSIEIRKEGWCGSPGADEPLPYLGKTLYQPGEAVGPPAPDLVAEVTGA